mmetsp:Transcript_43102/g.125445  ORF Transcript_43102/g.125445 Transcript_43102/m.125445 type:complete len:413 (-) Transcript_43102:197-1435(-)
MMAPASWWVTNSFNIPCVWSGENVCCKIATAAFCRFRSGPCRITTLSSSQCGAWSCFSMSTLIPLSSRSRASPAPCRPMMAPAARAGTRSFVLSAGCRRCSSPGSCPSARGRLGPLLACSWRRMLKMRVSACRMFCSVPEIVHGLRSRASSFAKTILTFACSRTVPRVVPCLPMTAPLSSFGIQKIAVVVSKEFGSTPDDSQAMRAALWTSCCAACTFAKVPMQTTRRLVSEVLAVTESLQPHCDAICWMLAPCLPTIAPVNFPGITKCIWIASGASGIGCTSLAAAPMAPRSMPVPWPPRRVPPAAGSMPPQTKPAPTPVMGKLPWRSTTPRRPPPRPRLTALPIARGSPCMMTVRSASPVVGLFTGSRSTKIRTPVVSRTVFSRSPPRPMIMPTDLFGTKIAAWTGPSCW